MTKSKTVWCAIVWYPAISLLLAGATPALAQTLPKIKAGLWQTSIDIVEGTEKTTQVISTQCIDSTILALIV